MQVYLSFCYDFRGELIENITSYSSPCSIYLNASDIIKLAEKTKCPNEGEPIYDDPLRASRNLFIRFLSTSGGATGHIDIFNGDGMCVLVDYPSHLLIQRIASINF